MEAQFGMGVCSSKRGSPAFFRSDNGSDFTAVISGSGSPYRTLEPETPSQENRGFSGFAESFHARLRAEGLNQEVFYSAKHAQVLLDDWRAFYNVRRPHLSLSYRIPDEVAEQARGRAAAPFAETTPQMWPSARPLGEPGKPMLSP
ncbi:transposase [Deinococcus radiopugnans ATCC 19172]|uniref:Transposase n=1 Tax=Deinococcus radiopugnans ATCC 19172 TaxID=585398 RepID=A0A5C4Y4B6_9DEIO|nr:transposase [Deinococcus radiopugnans ATCC 19172]